MDFTIKFSQDELFRIRNLCKEKQKEYNDVSPLDKDIIDKIKRTFNSVYADKVESGTENVMLELTPIEHHVLMSACSKVIALDKMVSTNFSNKLEYDIAKEVAYVEEINCRLIALHDAKVRAKDISKEINDDDDYPTMRLHMMKFIK